MKFYKILNDAEHHYGMKYQTGLNIDVLPFNPSGDCEQGGIYFAREDILSFVWVGPYIREVTLPTDAQLYLNPGFPAKWKADKVILGERREWRKILPELIHEGALVTPDFILTTARFGILEGIKLWLDTESYNSYAFKLVAQSGSVEAVKLLLDAGLCDVVTLSNAAESGHTACVKLLLDAGIRSKTALYWAASNGHAECVELLLLAGIRDEDALNWAASNGHADCVKLLLEAGIWSADVIKRGHQYTQEVSGILGRRHAK